MLFSSVLFASALASTALAAESVSKVNLVNRRSEVSTGYVNANISEASTGGFQFTSPNPIVIPQKKKPKKKTNPKLSSSVSASASASTSSKKKAKTSSAAVTKSLEPTAISAVVSASATPKPTSTSTRSRKSSSPSSTSTSSASESTASAASNSSVTLPKDYFFGVNSYYLYSIAQSDRVKILDEVKTLGATTVRIFITSIYANNKGSNNVQANDLEHSAVGTYDDSILEMIDQLMVEASDRGLKLIIALGDRYALGFWSTDTYATRFGIVAEGSSGDQKVADASNFYLNSNAITAYDNRIKHILNHKNSLLGNKPWSQLSEAIFAFEPQNEPMGHMEQVSGTWVCNRAKTIKSLTNIPVTTGGGITTAESLGDWAFNCDEFDIISVHDYGTSVDSTVSALKTGQQKALEQGKILLFEEWGALGDNKASTISSFSQKLKANDIPFMYWEIVNPGKGSADFEVWTTESSWSSLMQASPSKKKRGVQRRSVRHRARQTIHH